MDERASVFFFLLNELYKLDAGEKMHQLAIVSYPKLERQDQEKIREGYKQLATEPEDLFAEGTDDIQKLKSIL
jgi:hypothetical protein